MNGAFKNHPSRRRARENEPQSGKLFASDPPPQFLIKEPEVGYQRAERLLREWNQLKLEGPDISYAQMVNVASRGDDARLQQASHEAGRC